MMEALFLKILNMSVAAGLVALAVMALRLPLRRAPKWISYALWSVVFFRLVCPVSFESVLSLFDRFGTSAANTGSLDFIPADIVSSALPLPGPAGPSLSGATGSTLPQAASGTAASPAGILLTVGICVWLAGIAAMLVYSAVSYCKLGRKLADATLVEGNVYETDAIETPFVFGIFRPRIYLPIGLGEAQKRYVLLHERVHIRRGDYIVKPLALLALAVHWFNPVVWLAFRLMNLDLEMSCDERVIRNFTREETADYGEVLLRLRAKRPILAGSPLAFNENSTPGRIRNVLNYKKPAFWVVIIAVVGVAIACVCLISNPKKGNEDAQTTQAAAQATPVQNGEGLQIDYDSIKGKIIFIQQKLAGISTISPDVFPYPDAEIPDDITLSIVNDDLNGDSQINVKWFGDFLARFMNSRTYILDYLEANASGCYDVAATELPILVVADNTYMHYETTQKETRIYTNQYYWRANELYIFSLLNPNKLHWQHYGLAWYIDGMLNPYSEGLLIMQGEEIASQELYGRVYISCSGKTQVENEEDMRAYIDSIAYACLARSMNWGTAYASVPLNELNYFNRMDAEGDDMSVMMAASFTAWLADEYGFDKVVSYCSGQTDFEGAYGGAYRKINGQWRAWILDTYGE
ncbi:MAG TPA: M56 family metallopeptidase [Clostridia bacterium]|nr:M56 family metallopeptidase [Clostridia bacterium]